jgi:hypothetical protein
MKTVCLVIFSILLTACAATKNKNKGSLTSIDYKIKENNVFKDTIWKRYNKMERGTKKAYRLKNLKAKENPDPSFYTLRLDDNISKLSFHKPMNRDDGKSFHSWSAPLGKISFRKVDSSGVYKDYNQQIEGAYQKMEYKNLQWIEGKKDSTILGIKTHLMIGTNPTTQVKAWTTKRFPAALGIFDVKYDDGFILAYEIKEQNPKRGYKMQKLKIYPEEIKETSGKVEVPNWTKEVSKKDIEEYYRKLNEKNNG